MITSIGYVYFLIHRKSYMFLTNYLEYLLYYVVKLDLTLLALDFELV